MDPPAPKKGVSHSLARLTGLVGLSKYREVKQVSLDLEIGGYALARGLRARPLPSAAAAQLSPPLLLSVPVHL